MTESLLTLNLEDLFGSPFNEMCFCLSTVLLLVLLCRATAQNEEIEGKIYVLLDSCEIP